MTKRVLFLMSDTGGGHRAAAEAIIAALEQRYGDDVACEVIDVFRQLSFPMNRQPEIYPLWVNYGKTAWGMSYNLSNTRGRARVLSRGMYLTNSSRLRQMVQKHPADVVVSVHSVITRPSMRAYMSLDRRPPFLTVVTDLVSTHMFWYEKLAERTLVPTQAAYDRGIECGLRPDQLRITGLPVHPRFNAGLKDKAEARAELGWDPDLPAVLVIGGGEGMGPLYKTARAINGKNMKCQLAIVAGKNKPLKDRLDASSWNQPTTIYPFVRNIPVLMAAADILVTKAGPGTLCEASIAGLPMVLYDAIPGQETGNVEYIVENRAGVYAPAPQKVADAVEQWLGEGPEGLARRSASARRIARPNAVWDIAEEVWNYAHHPRIATDRSNLWKDVVSRTQQIRAEGERRLARYTDTKRWSG